MIQMILIPTEWFMACLKLAIENMAQFICARQLKLDYLFFTYAKNI